MRVTWVALWYLLAATSTAVGAGAGFKAQCHREARVGGLFAAGIAWPVMVPWASMAPRPLWKCQQTGVDVEN